MGGGFKRFTDIHAWQAALAYKRAVYRVCAVGRLSADRDLRDDLQRSVKGPPSHIAEGFGRFNPPDFARFVVVARASLMESQNHLIDAQDRGYISQETRDELNALAVVALKEATGLIEYLQSPEALRNAGRARGRGIRSWLERRDGQAVAEPKTGELLRRPEAKSEHEHEPGSRNPEE